MNSGVLFIMARTSSTVFCLAEAICSGRAGDISLAVLAIVREISDFYLKTNLCFERCEFDGFDSSDKYDQKDSVDKVDKA